MNTRRIRHLRSDGVPGPTVPRDGWSDGIHFVRPATASDRHSMRWVVDAHRTTKSPLKKRHVPSFEEGIAMAQEATTTWLRGHPADAFYITTAPQKKAVPVLASFSTTLFDCIVANPIAQVWQCNSVVGATAAIGRRTKEGRAPKQTYVPHAPGECAVLVGEGPVRNPDGQVRVYRSWVEAEEHALSLFESADEEERILWHKGDKRVGGTHHIDVIFDPDVNGRKRPFSLYLPQHRRPIYEDRTVMAEMPNNFHGTKEEIEEQRKAWKRLNRVPSFEERVLRFRSITGAMTEAEKRERMLGGIV